MPRDLYYRQSLGNSLNTLVKEARVLLVGAGGIGCELLKNLVLSDFGEIHIIDLDTIDLSNLNRQFLFRQENIKKSKAFVAKDAAQKFNPDVKLEAYMANITDPCFSIRWFRGFTLVFNALDNLQARRHVNKMCISADVPLIESGTTGFNGQVQVIKRGLTACYDCTPKEPPKTFPTCTIRSTPSQPIHCIVWGKSYLLNEIFGTSESESPDIDQSKDNENADDILNLQKETVALRKIRDSMNSASFPQLIFDKAFKDDIERLRSMDGLWKTRQAPEPLDFSILHAQAKKTDYTAEQVLKKIQKVWNVEENLIVFIDCVERLRRRILEMNSSTQESTQPVITFDKDDEDTLDFVTTSANLRSTVFGIERKSKFDVKQMAGNIIPAIATTNAIVAGLCVLQSFKILEGDFSNTKEVFLSPFAFERLLASDRCQKPNPECPVCSVAHNRVLVDVKNTTLNELVEDFLKLGLGYGEQMTINNGENYLLYDIDETVNLGKKLCDLGIKDDSFLTIVDENDDHKEGPRVNLILAIHDGTNPDGQLITSLDIPLIFEKDKSPLSPLIPRRKPKSIALEKKIEYDSTNIGDTTSKRHHSPDSSIDPNKKIKQETINTGKDSVEIDDDDDEDGVIMIE